MRFDYTMHIPGKDNVIADNLSRVNFVDSTKLPDVHFTEPCLQIESLLEESGKDRFLAEIRRRIIDGDWRRLSKREQPFKKISIQLTVDAQGLIRLGSRIVPPQPLQRQILEIAHQSHNGMDSTLCLVQREFYWPNMRSHIEGFVRGCQECNTARFRSPDTTFT